VQSEGHEPSTQPRAAQRAQVSDSSRSHSSSGEDGTPVSSPSLSAPGPSPSPGPGNTGPSSSTTITTTSIIPSSNSGDSSHSSTPRPGPSVADLLSKLRASQSLERPTSITTTNVAVGRERGDRTLVRERRSLQPPDHTPNATPLPVPVPQSISSDALQQSQQDMRTLSFHQALPHISQLMEDPHVVENLTKVANISLIHDFRLTSVFS
jgi:hypothetical protein